MSKRNNQNTKKSAPKILSTWTLASHYYTSERDPQIEKDIEKAERACLDFRKKYYGSSFTKDAETLLSALKEYETLIALHEGRRASRYFGFRHTLNAQDSVAEKRGNLVDERLTKAGNNLIFFELEIAKIPRREQKLLLTSPILLHYRYYLTRVFDEAEHNLTEGEERILSLKSLPASSLWIQATEKILSNRTIRYKGKEYGLPHAIELIDGEKPKDKEILWALITKELTSISEVVENELTAVLTNKKINDELRHYEKPYSQTVRSYENTEKSVESLVESVSTEGFALSRSFYDAKAKYHGLSKIPYVRKYDPIGKAPSISFDEAFSICREVFYGVNDEYGKIYDSLFHNGQVDVFPKKGKRGGAFMSAEIGVPTYVMLNHTQDLSSVTTLAHELGHAVHAERSKVQSPIYQGFSTTTAETASTLFENILMNTLIKNATGAEKLYLLSERITRSIATIERQIAFFNTELEMHTKVRTQGALTKEELAEITARHLRNYLGKSVEVTKQDGYSYVYIQHFRYGFYVYTYTYGHLMSSLMAKRLMHDPSYAREIDTFLSLGGSDTVENIFKKIGIHAEKPETFTEGLSLLKDDFKEFKRLIKE